MPHESCQQDPRPASKAALLFVLKSLPVNGWAGFLSVCALLFTSSVEATRNVCYTSSERSFSASGGCVGCQGSEGSSAVRAMEVQCIE